MKCQPHQSIFSYTRVPQIDIIHVFDDIPMWMNGLKREAKSLVLHLTFYLDQTWSILNLVDVISSSLHPAPGCPGM